MGFTRCPTKYRYIFFKANLTRKISDIAFQDWSSNVFHLKQCSNYRIFKKTLNLEKYLLDLEFQERLAFCKFRCGNHKLPISTNRYDIHHASPVCEICTSGDIGDEYHYLLVCTTFSEKRKECLKKYYYTRPNVLKFEQLLNLNYGKNLKKNVKFITFILAHFS